MGIEKAAGNNASINVKILMELIEARLPKATRSSAKQIGKLLEKLDPLKCGEDSPEVAKFVGKVARHPALQDQAILLLGCLENPTATDEFIELLEIACGTTDLNASPWSLLE